MRKISLIILIAALAMILAVAANAAVGEVAYARKTDKAPNMDEIDESWGEPSIYVTKDNPNAELVKYWQEFIDTCYYTTSGTGPNGRTTIVPEDSAFWMYFLYDEKNMYIGFRTHDEHITGGAGGEESHRGDGIHMWLQPLADMRDPYGEDGCSSDETPEEKAADASRCFYFWDLQFDDWTTGWGYGCDLLDEPPKIIQFDDGRDELHCVIKIPLSQYGLKGKDLHGFEFGMTVMRVSSISLYDEGYAGWLAWGKTLVEYGQKPQSVNTVILYDPARGIPGSAEDTETGTKPNLDGVSSWALTEVEAGIAEGLVPHNLQSNYTLPVTRGAVAQMFINLLEKAAGKSIEAIMAEKHVSINEGAFEDTTDRAVLAANALGIINGTSKTKFSPDGTLKRAQIAAIINRVARVMGIDTEGFTHEFTDITGNYSWADTELGWPVHAGVINGVGQGRFNPGGDLTTEQAILITYRALGALK